MVDEDSTRLNGIKLPYFRLVVTKIYHFLKYSKNLPQSWLAVSKSYHVTLRTMLVSFKHDYDNLDPRVRSDMTQK